LTIHDDRFSAGFPRCRKPLFAVITDDTFVDVVEGLERRSTLLANRKCHRWVDR
jgi:hypothetical protein